jgi:uncharacterized protein YcaQ
MLQVSWDQALAWRLERHRLVERATPRELVDVIARIGGLHAQLMSSAELSLWARVEGLDRDALADALWKERSLVKLWAMRGTLHVLPAAELGLWLAGLGTYTHYGNQWPETDELAAAVERSLDSRLLTREELATRVEQLSGSRSFGEQLRESWGSYLKALTFRGLVCFAPSDGGRVRFTRTAHWVRTRLERHDPDDALREIGRRYLGAYGPATTAELARWWGGGRSRGARMIEALADEAVEVDLEGERAFVLEAHLNEVERAEPPNVARLVPAFDPWVASVRSGLVGPTHAPRVYRPQGWMSPALLLNGRVAGVWRHARRGGRLVVEIEPFGRLPRWSRGQIEAEAARLADFLGGELELHR